MDGCFNRSSFLFQKSGVLLCIGAALACSLPALKAQQAAAPGGGLYSKAQAERGQQLYQARCATCHGAAMGGGLAPPLTGSAFLAVWGGQPVGQLTSKILKTMPPDDPGKLTLQQAAELVANLLQKSNFPAGSADLPADEKALSAILLPGKPAAASAAGTIPAFPPVGNLAQLMRGILFPSSNMIFNVQTNDPGVPVPAGAVGAGASQSFSWVDWGAGIYKGWEIVDYAAVAVADSAPLLLTPGRRCENGRPVPVDRPDWIRFTQEMAEAGRAAYKASQSRSQEAVSDSTNQLADSCLHCHQVYRDKRGGSPGDPSNKAARCLP
jgi:mono/diheme cytochrome c family protein